MKGYFKTWTRAAIAGVAWVYALVALLPAAALAQSTVAGQGTMPAGAQAAFITQPNSVPPSPEQQRLRDEWIAKRPSGPPVAVEGAQVRAAPEVLATNAPGEQLQGPQAAGTFTIFRTHEQPAFPGQSKSDVNEPSVGAAGSVVFISSNWDAAVSTDGGGTFALVNPYTTFPSMDGGFCCDQTVTYDRSRDLFAWSLQYIKSGSTSSSTGGWRTAFANSSAAGTGSWCYYTWHPDNFGLPATGRWLDYPDVSVSNGFIWYSVNVFTTTSDTWTNTLVWRIPLNAVSTCSGFTYDYFVVSDRFTFSLVQGATTTMYWASHNSTSSIRIYNWPESSGTISWNDVAVTAWFDNARVCTTPDSLNPCGRADGSHGMTGWVAGGVLGWMWSSSSNSGGGRPFPYIRVARFLESTKALINEPDIWNGSGAFIYNAVAVNARGHLAGIVYFAGGGFYQYAALIIWDDFSSAPAPWEIYYQAQSSAGTNSRWGDFYATRPHGLYPNTWVSVGAVKTASGSNAGVHTLYFWYGRERDMPATAAGANSHDFNGDGRSDIAWREAGGAAAVWLMNGAAVVQSAGFGVIPTTWSIVGQRDFNGDGKYDWLWRDSSGNLALWFLNGVQISSSAGLGAVATNWVIASTGDFNGDGKGDILWRDNNTGTVAIWLMNGAQVSQSAGLGAVASNWIIAKTGDFNGDGKRDILWRDTNSGAVAIWFMNGTQVASGVGLGTVPTNWVIWDVGDFNGDGKWDILWRDSNSGTYAIWLMNGSQVTASGSLGAVSGGWVVLETGDFNGDGKSDLLWRENNTGGVAIWFLNGTQVSSGAGLGNVPTSWAIQWLNAD